jgi:hypothetical protein
MKCFWCGKLNNNVEITESGKMVRVFPCDSCQKLESGSVLCNMTQKEWEEKTRRAEIVPIKFNRICRGDS